jgi:hypothetical protein
VSSYYRRPILLHDITARSKLAPVAFASPEDFTLSTVSTIDTIRPQDNAVIYCFDPGSERALFTLCDDLRALLQAPFLYEAQFAAARQIVTVPFERLEECACARGATPVFVFSIGRCGSTLLTALLGAIGANSVSEPDVLTQLAELPAPTRARLSPAALPCLIRACVGSLRTHCGDGVVIKLRSQCIHIAAAILHACPDAKFVFMLRDRHAWAQSRHRAFGETPVFIAHLLARSIQCIDELAQAGCDLHIVWYEELRDAPTATLRRLGMFDAALSRHDAVALSAVSAQDSQAGSHLAQRALRRTAPGPYDLAAFEKTWSRIRPDALLERHGLQRLS